MVESRKRNRLLFAYQGGVMSGPGLFRRVLLFSLLGLWITAAAHAQSGCCSHHGGVCGCRCCDGSPLSNICAPYFPNCGGGGSSSPPAAPYNLTLSLSSPTE